MEELENTKITNKSYISTTSYRTSMSLIKNLQQITMAIYMVTDCVEDDEPLRNQSRSAVLKAMNSIANVMGKVQVTTSELRSTNAQMILVRQHISVLEIMGYISSMNASILLKEIDRFITRLDTSILDIGSAHESKNLLRSDMSFGVDLGELFYKNKNNLSSSVDNINTEKTFVNNGLNQNTRESFEQPLGKIEKEMGRLQRRSLILKLFRELPSQSGFKELTLNELVEKYVRYGGEGQISEKTIRRELNEMIQDGTLEKIGTKRWVRYRLVHSS